MEKMGSQIPSFLPHTIMAAAAAAPPPQTPKPPPQNDTVPPIPHTNHTPKRHRNRPQQPPRVTPDDMAFRILCNVPTGGGIIGSSGVIVQQLSKETGARIHCFDPVPRCDQRMVLIVGSRCINRVVEMVNDEDESNIVEFEVSSAQEAMYRVMEKVLQIEGGREGCRLVADSSQIGWVIGKGGKTIQRIMSKTGATIKIHPPPACALENDKLIQITGDILAMNKALHSVSCCLQNCPPLDKAAMLLSRAVETPPHGDFPDPHSEFFPHLSLILSHPPAITGVPPVNSVSMSVGANVFANEDMKKQHEVVFRLLCPSSVARGVIGHKGSIVRTLQNETGATIIFAAPVDDCDERVVTISAIEDLESLYSPVQNGIFRVFDSYTALGIRSGMLYGLSKGSGVQARLLVEPDIVDVLSRSEGKTVVEIKESTGADIKILDGDHVPACGLENDLVVQISGDYKKVRSALFQVTSRLRNSQLSTEEFQEGGARTYPSIAIPQISLASGIVDPKIVQALGLNTDFHEASITNGMEQLGVSSNKVDSSLPSLEPPQMMHEAESTAITEKGTTFITSGGIDLGRSASVVKTTVEIAVPKQFMGSIYGDDGNNLAQMRKISGANVEVYEPEPGKVEGKVIISGIPKQTLAAQNLLQAFLLLAE